MLKRSDLYQYQRSTVELLVQFSHFGGFLEMGLGKTVSTLTAFNDLKYSYLDVETMLVVAPKRVIESVWAQEGQKWEHLQHLKFSAIHGTPKQRAAAIDAPADVYLVSRDNIAWLCDQFKGPLPYDVLTIDESSSFKNPSSKRFKALRKKLPSFSRVYILTGTPSPKGAQDLWAQIYLLDRGERLCRTVSQFRSAFLYPALADGHVVYKYGCRPESFKKIQSLISDIVVSMEQKDYLELPEFTERELPVQMPAALSRKYKDFEREKVLELFGDGEAITAANAAALTGKLLQFANGAVYDEDKKYHEIHGLKLDALADIMEEAQGSPVLVAYTFRHDAERIMERFKKYKPRKLDTTADVEAWNRGEIDMLITHPASTGHGLNLQHGGHIIVWFGNTWDLELLDQLNHRLKRPGQKNRVVINKIVLQGTEDERVLKAQQRKGASQSDLMQSVRYLVSRYAAQSSQSEA